MRGWESSRFPNRAAARVLHRRAAVSIIKGVSIIEGLGGVASTAMWFPSALAQIRGDHRGRCRMGSGIIGSASKDDPGLVGLHINKERREKAKPK